MRYFVMLFAAFLVGYGAFKARADEQRERATAFQLLKIDLEACPVCAAWDKTVLPFVSGSEQLERLAFVSLKVKTLADGEYRFVPTPRDYPTFVLVDNTGGVHGTMTGYIERYAFLAQLDQWISDFDLR